MARAVFSSRFAVVIVLSASLSLGCGGDDRSAVSPSAPSAPTAAKTATAKAPAPTPAKAKAAEAKPAPKVAPKADPRVEEASKRAAAKRRAAAKAAVAAKQAQALAIQAKPISRETLEKAYLEISCIQKRGEAAKLLEAYKKYGFADPRGWIRAWEGQKKAADYEQWLAALTQKAWQACP